MKTLSQILLLIVLASLFCGCPADIEYYNSVGFQISANSDSTWLVSASQDNPNGDEFYATINGHPYQLLGQLPVDIEIPQSEELIVGMTSHSRARLDRLKLPQSPLFEGILLNGISLIPDDTVSIPINDLYTLSWNQLYSNEVISTTDSIEFRERCSLYLKVDDPYPDFEHYQTYRYRNDLTRKIYESSGQRNFEFSDTSLTDYHSLVMDFNYSTNGSRDFREYTGANFRDARVYWIHITY
jgi:hypothetical protein